MRTVLGLALSLFTTAALAGTQDFTLVNRTGYTINEVYVSHTSTAEWGNDIMGKGTLADGEAVGISFNAPDDACTWDLKVKYDDGSDAVWGGVNLCKINKISIFWDKDHQQTRAVAE